MRLVGRSSAKKGGPEGDGVRRDRHFYAEDRWVKGSSFEGGALPRLSSLIAPKGAEVKARSAVPGRG
jgi:hypothetical protein